MHDLPDLDVACALGVEDEEFIAEGDVITASVSLAHRNLGPEEAVPAVFAPLFPLPRKEAWYLFITNAANNKLVAMKTARDVSRG